MPHPMPNVAAADKRKLYVRSASKIHTNALNALYPISVISGPSQYSPARLESDGTNAIEAAMVNVMSLYRPRNVLSRRNSSKPTSSTASTTLLVSMAG